MNYNCSKWGAEIAPLTLENTMKKADLLQKIHELEKRIAVLERGNITTTTTFIPHFTIPSNKFSEQPETTKTFTFKGNYD